MPGDNYSTSIVYAMHAHFFSMSGDLNLEVSYVTLKPTFACSMVSLVFHGVSNSRDVSDTSRNRFTSKKLEVFRFPPVEILLSVAKWSSSSSVLLTNPCRG